MNQNGHIKGVTEDENGYRQFIVNCLGNNDQRKYFSITPFGIDFVAPENVRGLTADSRNKDESYLIGVLNKIRPNDLNPGESAIFSTDGNELKSFIKLRNDGTMEQNGTDDNIAGFIKLKEGFDQVVSDYNNAIAEVNKITQALTSWVPVPQDGGAALKTIYSGNPSQIITDSTASIDDSKKDNLKIE